MKKLDLLFENLKFVLLLIMIVAVSTSFFGCKDDDDVNPLVLSSITADDIALDGATAANDVPVDANIVIAFDRNVNTAGNVVLSHDDGPVDADVSVVGNTILVEPVESLDPGTTYTLLVQNVVAQDGGVYPGIEITFTTYGKAFVTPPKNDNMMAYWMFDGNTDDRLGNHTTADEVAITYTTDRAGFENSAVLFNGNSSIIEIDNGADLLTQDWTLSFWMRLDTVNHLNADGNKANHFVMGVGAFHGFQVEVGGDGGFIKKATRYSTTAGTSIPNDFFINADGQSADQGGWEGIEYERDLTPLGGLSAVFPQQWAHVIFTYNSQNNTRTLYINGDRIQTDNFNNVTALANINGMTFDLAGTAETIGDKLAFGFAFDRSTTLWQNEPWGSYNSPTSNHFKGALDDVRFFNTFYTDDDAQNLHNAERVN
jgi:hypothetical protein